MVLLLSKVNYETIMKKYIALLTIAAFALAAYAGDMTCPAQSKAGCAGKDKAACAEKAKAGCPGQAKAGCPGQAKAGCADQAKAGGCCAKSAAARKLAQSPKATGEAAK